MALHFAPGMGEFSFALLVSSGCFLGLADSGLVGEWRRRLQANNQNRTIDIVGGQADVPWQRGVAKSAGS
jgi:hypothetical protein